MSNIIKKFACNVIFEKNAMVVLPRWVSLRDFMLKPAGPWMDPYFHLLINCILIVFYCGGRGDRTAAKY